MLIVEILLLSIIPKKIQAQESIPIISQEITYTKEQLVQKVYKYAELYNVSPQKMLQVISCENDTWNIRRQSELHYNFSSPKRGIIYGEQEKSFGLVMIHLPDHPEITYDQAINPDFAIQYLARKLHDGKGKMWSCYK